MDGKTGTVRDRWFDRAEAAYRRMFEGKSRENLVTLTQRETMAVSIAKELARFLLEEEVAQGDRYEGTQIFSVQPSSCLRSVLRK